MLSPYLKKYKYTPIILNPLNYNCIALQEIGISLSSGNIGIPLENPAIIYFELDARFSYHLKYFSNYKIRKQFIEKIYE